MALVSRSPDRRQATVVLLGIAVAGLALYGWLWHADRAYVGATRRVSLTWQCWNGIVWTDPDSGVRWLATPPVPLGVGLETAPRDPQGPTKHADGHLHFDTREAATFTSDGGASMRLERQPPNRLYPTSCSIDAGP